MLGVIAACNFEHGALDEDTGGMCTPTPSPAWWNASYAHRFLLDHQAPTGYTLQVDATQILLQSNTSTRDDVRVVAGDVEIDRLITGSTLELRVPAEGSIYIYTGNVNASSPPADPSRVYLFAESFDGFPLGDNVSARFDPQPSTDWAVVDDAGNHVFHAQGAARHPAAIKGMTMTDGEISTRIRLGTGGTQQHDGLGARGNSMQPATMDGFVGQLQGDLNRIRIAEYQNGATPPPVLTDQPLTVVRGQWYRLRLRFFGDNVALALDGVPTLSTTQPGSDGMDIGLYAHDCDVDYDDVRVRMYAEPEPTYTIGPDEPRCAK